MDNVKWQTRDEMSVPTNPLQKLTEILTSTSRDTGEDKMIAYMYGIIVGWSDESYEEFKTKHGWSDEDIRYQKLWHENYIKAWDAFMNINNKITPKVRKLKIDSDTDWNVEVKVGDRVMDMYGDEGSFCVEEINNDGWVWGREMKRPYYAIDNIKNFVDYNMTWKI